MIKFTKIRYMNLLSTGNDWTEISLSEKKNTLICGPNGSGKSTLLDALSFALFGKPFRKINKPQLVNSITQKNCLVELVFETQGSEYKLIRGIKPNVFEVYKNNKKINQDTDVDDYQKVLERTILKFNHRTFSQVFVIGTATYTPFMSLTAAARRETIEELLDLKIFTSMNKKLKAKIEETLNSVREIAHKKELLEQKIELIKQHFSEIQSNTEKMIQEKRERVADARKQIEELNDRARDLALSITDKSGRIISDGKTRYDELLQLRSKLVGKQQGIKKDLEFYQHEETCPTCRQSIQETFRETRVTEATESLKVVTTARLELDGEILKAKAVVDSNDEIKREIQKLTLEKSNLSFKIQSLEEYMSQLNDEIKSIRKNTTKDDKVQIEELNVQILQLEESFNAAMTTKLHQDYLALMLKDQGIKAQVIKQYVPIVNSLMNKYLAEMDFFVQFHFDENFNEVIKSRFRDDFSYESFSEGEKFRINLAILFTWRAIAKKRNSVSTNLLIMDEAMDSSLDVSGTADFLKLVLKTDDTNVFIISHKTDQISDSFDSIIRFQKNKNFSKVVYHG